jgi:hypothetical protein
MATATRKNPSPQPPPRAKAAPDAEPKAPSLVWRVFDATFRFLASVKLAVVCLATLSAVLAFGTRFNSWYGMNAANEYIYQAKWFAVLLAFLGTNILCAALIRYPWKKRQIGFLITHAGLLTVIFGSWWSAQYADEGQLGMLEGETSSKLVRNHKPVVLVRPIDPHTGRPTGEYVIPAQTGSFDWPAGKYQVISTDREPFKLALKAFYVASIPGKAFVADPNGGPMLKLRPRVIPPGQKLPVDVFKDEDERWFALGQDLPRLIKDAGPAQFIFSAVNQAEILDDFLNPPADPGVEGVARFHYADQSGKPRVFDVRVDDAMDRHPILIPDSDLTVTFIRVEHEPVDERQRTALRTLGDQIDSVRFNVRKGTGPAIKHGAIATWPEYPPTKPIREKSEPDSSASPLLTLNYFYPPVVDPEVNRRFGVVEVMVDPSGRMGYRVFERGTPAKVRSVGLLEPGKEITAFGGNDKAPMTMVFSVEDYLPRGIAKEIAESVDMPPNKKDDGLGAVLAEMTVDGVTKEIWLRKSPTFDPTYETLAFGDKLYEIAFDSDRLDLGFSLFLKDFDVGFDPGTSNPASYKSDVRLTDEAAGIKDQPHLIYMNYTLDHKGWRFFQSNYAKYRDPRTGEFTGEFQSVFQVAKDPGRELKYLGCIVVVAGAFVQFYMRAGVFSDGGKRQSAAEKARRRLLAKQGLPETDPADDAEPL